MVHSKKWYTNRIDELKKADVKRQQAIVSKLYGDREQALAIIRYSTNSSGRIWSTEIGGYQPFYNFAIEAIYRSATEGQLSIFELKEEVVPILVQTHSGLAAMSVEEYLEYVTGEGERSFSASW